MGVRDVLIKTAQEGAIALLEKIAPTTEDAMRLLDKGDKTFLDTLKAAYGADSEKIIQHLDSVHENQMENILSQNKHNGVPVSPGFTNAQTEAFSSLDNAYGGVKQREDYIKELSKVVDKPAVYKKLAGNAAVGGALAAGVATSMAPDNAQAENFNGAKEVLMKLIRSGKADEALKLMDNPNANAEIRQLAEQFKTKFGLTTAAPETMANVNPKRAEKIAKAFDQMEHNPDDPKVKAAYDALVKETVDQYKHIKGSGLKVSKIQSGAENPYKSSADLLSDIKNNNHMSYYPTEQGFGTSPTKYSDHPLLKATDELDADGNPMPANDLFRIVHNYFGHGKEGLTFGPKGEENAWRQHAPMFSPEAQKALASETRGQNSWVNFGPHAEMNRANPANTTYADQKAGLLPDWALNPEASLGEKVGDTAKALAPAAVGAGALGYSGDAYGKNTQDTMNRPMDALKEVYNGVRKPILDATTKVGETIADTVRPNIPLSEESKQQERDFAGGATMMGLDPINFIAPGAGMAMGAADMTLLDEQKKENKYKALKALLGQ